MVKQTTPRATKIAILLITVAIVTLLMKSTPTSAQGNATPIITEPQSTTLSYMFPRGYFTRLNFPSAPATDTDTPEKQISYRFTFTIPDASTTDNSEDTTEVDDAAAALLTVKRVGNTFEFVAIDNVTPKQFNQVYGDVHEYIIPGKMYAYDNNSLSDPLGFTIEAHYDASPQWHLAADYWQYHIWRLKEEISIYEGPNANQQLATIILGDYDSNGAPQNGQPTRLTSPNDVLQIPWTASFGGARTWTTGDPTGTTDDPYLKCLENHRSIRVLSVWSPLGSEDSALVTVAGQTQTKNGHATLQFINPTTDYESPTDTGQDNSYQFRLVSRHGIHNLGDKSIATLGCDGSALDLKVKVKDVGPPAPIPGMDLTLEPNKDAAFKIDWDLTKFDQFLDDGTRVDFPHDSFDVSQITVSHDPPGLTFPEGETATEITFPYSSTDVPDLTGITGDPGTTYTVTITLTNSEGESEPVSQTIEILGPPDRPDAPTVTTAGPTSLDVSWTAPETNGIPIDGYSLQTRKEGELNWTYWNLGRNTATSATITTLEPDTTYEVDLKAHSGNQGSDLSEPTNAKTEAFNPSIYHLFPNGSPTKLYFDGPVAGDPDGTGATYVFTFAKQGGTQGVQPLQMLLSVEGPDEDHDFTIKAVDNTTIEEFRNIFDGTNTVTLTVTLTATNTITYSTDLSFTLNLAYDDSAQFGSPAVHQTNNRWTVADAYETYEGSTSLPDITIPWTALTSGTRRWSTSTPAGVTFECRGYDLTTWPADDDKDSGLFTVTSATAATSGTLTVAFATAPDYENPTDDEATDPGDNVYHLRITNDHDLHELSTQPENLGCNGSAVDITIKVKNVGTPSPVTPTGQFATGDTSEINLEWQAPTGFMEDGTSVAFPHTDFAPSTYDYRYRPTTTDPWIKVSGVTTRSATITRLTETSYQIQVTATNSEGASPWPTQYTTISREATDPQASISAVKSPISEGDNAEFRVDLDKTATITVNLTYTWTGGYGTSTGDTLTFSSSDTKIISIPTLETTSTSDGSLTVTVSTGTDYTVGTPSSDTIIISRAPDKPEQPTVPTVTGLSTTSLEVSWVAPTSTLPITSYTLQYKKTGDSDWKTQSSTSTPATITGLTVNTEYQVQVSATNSDGDSAPSAPGTASTLDLTVSIEGNQAEVTEGQNITATVTLSRAVDTAVSLEYSWTGDFGTDTTETIQIPTGTTKTVIIPTKTSTTTQAGSITVHIATSDAYRVIGTPAAVTIQKLPKASITTITSTVQEASNAEIRIDLDRSADVIVNLDLQWSNDHGTSTSSTVQFNASASETASIATNANGTDGSLTVTVTRGTGYTVGTPSSATVTITKQLVVQEAPETPATPTVTALSTTSLDVSWVGPTSTPATTGYSLRYKKTGDPDWETQSSTTTTATITDLTVNTEYQVEVLATNSIGDSEFSSPGTGSTLDLTASISASPTEITEGDYVTFTVTLSRSENDSRRHRPKPHMGRKLRNPR